MFNLDQSIADWRSQMLAVGIKTPAPLEELEIHLREEIEQQMKSGVSEQTAFEISVQRIGQPKTLDGEFKKSERTFMKQTAKISTGVASILIGMAFTIPGSIQLRDELVMANSKFGLWLLGVFLICWSSGLFQQIFLPKVFKGEFEKAEMTPVKQTVKTGAGVAVLLMGLAFTMPPVVQGLHEGAVKFDGVCYVIFGNALLLAGAVVTFCPYKKHVA